MSAGPSRGSLLVVFLTVFVDLLGFGIVLPLLPIYAEQFGADPHGVTIGLLMASFSAMQFLFAPLWGRLSDRVGRRPVLMIGLAGSVAFYALFGVGTMWQSLPLLFVARIGAGIAGATIPTAQAYIADTTTKQNRARGMALIGAGFGLGFTFGPLLAAAALLSGQAEVSPWPGFLAAGLSGVSLILAAVLLPESLTPDSEAARAHFFDLRALSRAMSMPSIPSLLLVSFLSVLAFGGFETTLSLMLSSDEGAYHYAPHEVAFYFAYIGLVLSLAQGGLVRRLAKKVPEQTLAFVGGAVSVVGFCLLSIATARGELWLLMLATAVEVTGFAFVTPSLQSLISRRSDPHEQGGVLGLAQSIGSLARIFGPLISIPLFFIQATLPYWISMGMMAISVLLLVTAVRAGHDFAAE